METAQRGQQWLESLLSLMGIPAAVKTGAVGEGNLDLNSCWLIIEETELNSEVIKTTIGERGESIDAIQYLANTLLNIGVEQELQKSFTVELDGYRIRRQKELIALAQETAQQVRETGKEVEIKSLSSAERRQIHSFLQDAEDLKTESRGQEPDRRLIVRLR